MPPTNSRRREFQTKHRSEKERGAALVEAAIVFLPLCFIVFGIIEYGLIFKDSLTLSSATRAGARVASAEARQSTFITDAVKATSTAAVAGKFTTDDLMWVYKADTTGQPLNGCPSATCVVYRYQSGSNWVYDSGTWDPLTHNACLGGPSDDVGVRLSLHHKAATGWFADIILHERTVMRLEPLESNCS